MLKNKLLHAGASCKTRNALSSMPRWWAILMLAVLLGLAGCGGSKDEDIADALTPPVAGVRVLAIAPVMQQTEVWCWAASAEMLFRYYGLPNLSQAGYQCGIVAAYYGPSSICWVDCVACRTAIGSMSEMQALVNGYGQVAKQLQLTSRVLASRLRFGALSFEDTASEINAGRPILAGISPSGYAYPNFSEHAVLIVGYRNDATGQWLLVNDPFPYEYFPANPNPYAAAGALAVQPGRYQVPYVALVSRLRWANSIDRIR